MKKDKSTRKCGMIFVCHTGELQISSLKLKVALNETQLLFFWTPAYAGVTVLFLQCHSRESGNPVSTCYQRRKK
jgi:hypothetical protein